VGTKRTAIVVGGGGGIGSAVCMRLAQADLRVVIVDIAADRANDVLAALPGDGHSIEALDVTYEHAVDDVFERIETHHPAAVLVTIVGGPLADPDDPPTIVSMKSKEWEGTFRFNVTGTFNCLRKFAQLRRRRPLENTRIITFGSITGQVGGSPTGVAYAASKAAIFGLTRQVAAELSKDGITVNCLAPGAVGTSEFYRLTTSDYAAAVAATIPLGRLGTPQEIAAAVAFLASEEASYLTGVVLDVNGGIVMR
jgi:NAD(P)-dependent dehydrogenase (short-subunit alcohol dehydrogenase family)